MDESLAERIEAADEKLVRVGDDVADIASEIESIVNDHVEVEIRHSSRDLAFRTYVDFEDAEAALNDRLPENYYAVTDRETLVVRKITVNAFAKYDIDRERVRNLKQLIAAIVEENEDGAPVDEVLDNALILGYSERAAEKRIAGLKGNGELYEVEDGYLRLT